MHAGSLCDEDLVRRLPLPLAQLYRRAHNAKAPLERHLTAFYLWEAALKLLGSVAIVEFAESGAHDPQLADCLIGSLLSNKRLEAALQQPQEQRDEATNLNNRLQEALQEAEEKRDEANRQRKEAQNKQAEIERQRAIAEEQALNVRRHPYVLDMNMAQRTGR